MAAYSPNRIARPPAGPDGRVGHRSADAHERRRRRRRQRVAAACPARRRAGDEDRRSTTSSPAPPLALARDDLDGDGPGRPQRAVGRARLQPAAGRIGDRRPTTGIVGRPRLARRARLPGRRRALPRRPGRLVRPLERLEPTSTSPTGVRPRATDAGGAGVGDRRPRSRRTTTAVPSPGRSRRRSRCRPRPSCRPARNLLTQLRFQVTDAANDTTTTQIPDRRPGGPPAELDRRRSRRPPLDAGRIDDGDASAPTGPTPSFDRSDPSTPTST